MSQDDEATRRRADLQPGGPGDVPAAPPGAAGPEGGYAGQPAPASPPPPQGGWGAPPPAYPGGYDAAAPQYRQPYAPTVPYAGWFQRVGASLIDAALQLIGLVPYGIGIGLLIAGLPKNQYDTYSGTTTTTIDDGNSGLVVSGVVLMIVGFVVMLGINWWNRWLRMGRTGQSVGKRVLGITLVEERTGQPIGAGMAFLRDLAHVLDGFFYLGYLWPLWDDKRQTFADKVCSTVVVERSPAYAVGGS